ncbi:heterocyst development glycosyltransferase HepC [Chroococcus sp. FPU101]|uniref:heterocyst development glycosyltransferase HepC n=1 Tax=Chroococcus sp. FPU101 TaxID=1974212 RepID=UPI001A90B4DE|nr:heterocyst development glycosyltransferase HepC [Chroococcus sp. FPU101]GFE68220.1 sugar transferase [Chroococcus sp. FPU101]
MNTSILLKNPQLITLPHILGKRAERLNPNLTSCTLKWRHHILWIKQAQNLTLTMPSLSNREWLISCLQHSSAKLVCLDPQLGEARIQFWADACKKANKRVILKVPNRDKFFQKQCSPSWWLKRTLDWIAAFVLLLLLSPLLIILAGLLKITSPGSIFFRQWRVGKGGQLFEIIKFRTMIAGAENLHHEVMKDQQGLHKCENDPRVTPLGAWMRKFSFDELPQLLNVLRGEMSLVGPRPWALYDALRFKSPGKKRLKALPGITGPWQVATRSSLRDLDAVSQCELEYLRNWSLWKDAKLLIMTIPRVVMGSDAY